MTQADVNLARDRFLSISGNLEGMEIKRNEFDVSLHGLDPEAAKAITAILNSREGQAVIARYAGSKKKKKGKRK